MDNSNFCYSDDPNMSFAEITDEFEPCSLSESEDDSHGGTKTHMSQAIHLKPVDYTSKAQPECNLIRKLSLFITLYNLIMDDSTL